MLYTHTDTHSHIHTHPKILHIYTIKIFNYIYVNKTIYRYHKIYTFTNILHTHTIKVLTLYKIL